VRGSTRNFIFDACLYLTTALLIGSPLYCGLGGSHPYLALCLHGFVLAVVCAVTISSCEEAERKRDLRDKAATKPVP